VWGCAQLFSISGCVRSIDKFHITIQSYVRKNHVLSWSPWVALKYTGCEMVVRGVCGGAGGMQKVSLKYRSELEKQARSRTVTHIWMRE
jgi:hypothetical protein